MRKLLVVLGTTDKDTYIGPVEDVRTALFSRKEVWIDREELADYTKTNLYQKVCDEADFAMVPADLIDLNLKENYSGIIVYGMTTLRKLSNQKGLDGAVYIDQYNEKLSKEHTYGYCKKSPMTFKSEDYEVPIHVVTAASEITTFYRDYMWDDEENARKEYTDYMVSLRRAVLYSFDDRPIPTYTKTKFAKTVGDLKTIVEYSIQGKAVAFDFETQPEDKELEEKFKRLKAQGKIKKTKSFNSYVKDHNVNFKKSEPTILTITHREGSGWVIPMKHFTSWFNINLTHTYSFVDITEEGLEEKLNNLRIASKTYESWENEYNHFHDLLDDYKIQLEELEASEADKTEEGLSKEALQRLIEKTDVELDRVEEILDVFESLLDKAKPLTIYTPTEKSLMIDGDRISRKYNKEIAVWDQDNVEAFISNYLYCIEHNVIDMMKEVVIPTIAPIFSSHDIIKIGHNGKFDYKHVRKMGIKWGGLLYDTMFMVHVLNELAYRTSKNGSKSLKAILPIFFPEFLNYGDHVDFVNSSLNELGVYGATDTDGTFRLRTILESELLAIPTLYRFFRSYINPVVLWLAELEYRGAQFDYERLMEAKEMMQPQIDEAETFLREFPEVIAVENKFYKEKIEAYINKLQGSLFNSHKKDVDRIKVKADKQATKIDELDDKLIQLKKDLADGKPKVTEKTVAACEKKIATAESLLNFLENQEKIVADRDYFHDDYPYKQTVNYATKVRDAELGIHEIEKDRFNFNSAPQMYQLLYWAEEGFKYGKPEFRKRKTNPKTGRYYFEQGAHETTDKKYLKDFDDPRGFIHNLLVYKALTKLMGTYIEGMTTKMDKDGRVHTDVKFVRTGRFGSSDPNLQNIPSRAHIKALQKASKSIKYSITTPLSIPEDWEYPVPYGMREDWAYLEADYSQCEVRVMAQNSGDKNLAQVYRDGGDVHESTGAFNAGVPLEEFQTWKNSGDPDLEFEYGDKRFKAKGTNFSCIYVVSATGLQEYAKHSYGVVYTEEEAQEQINNFYSQYYSIPDYHQESIQHAEKWGYVETSLGCRRHLPNISSGDIAKRNQDRRIACNSPTQGTGAQLLGLSAVALDLRNFVLQLGGHIELTVHDSLVGPYKKEYEKEWISLLLNTCNKPLCQEYFNYEMDLVPLKTDVGTSDVSWAECDEWKDKDYEEKHILDNSKLFNYELCPC